MQPDKELRSGPPLFPSRGEIEVQEQTDQRKCQAAGSVFVFDTLEAYGERRIPVSYADVFDLSSAITDPSETVEQARYAQVGYEMRRSIKVWR